MAIRPAGMVAVAAALALSLPACARPAPTGATPGATGTLTVFAAASLKGTFAEFGQLFEARHPGVTVALNLAGSATLVEQLDQGAGADLLATADEATMAAAVRAGLVADDPVAFAANRLTIVVPPGNPAGITRLADLTRPGLGLVSCAPTVPCGAATARVAAAAGVSLAPVSEELAVGDVLAKVRAREADAGLVYATDALAAGDSVEVVPLDQSAGVVNRYPIAVLAGAAEPALAADFLDLVTGTQGRAILDRAGFRRP